jgi:hypothetical protein
MKLLKEIIEHWGFIDSKQLPELAEHFPDTPLVIKWGGMPRERLAASKVAKRIEEVEQWDQDYVREVFICAKQMEKLREVFGLTETS